jgi:hypothetical protein
LYLNVGDRPERYYIKEVLPTKVTDERLLVQLPPSATIRNSAHTILGEFKGHSIRHVDKAQFVQVLHQ